MPITVLEENTPMAESTASKSHHKAKDQALENPEKRSSRVIEESDNEELAPPPPGPPSQYQFKPPPRVFRQQYKKGHNLKTFELPEDSDGDGDSDASDMVSSESKESDLLEPEESVARALFEEVKVTSTREKKRAMETPRWNESVSTISEFDSSLILADSSFADESDVPVKEEDTEDIQGSARNTTASTQSKEGYRDPMAHLVYTKTGVIQHGILELKAYIAFSHGYPEVIAKNTYAREILINAAQYLKTEPIEKCALVGLIDAHASLFCRDIKETASKNIAGYFHLGPNCSAILERLLPDHLYIFPQIFDVQGLPYPVCRKPYQADPIFIILFEMFFKNMKSVGSQFPQQFFNIAKNKAQRPEIPISMLAIVCTAICAALLAKKNKSGEEFKFTGNQFCDNYNYHISVLERLRETAPIKFHKMMSDIYEEVHVNFTYKLCTIWNLLCVADNSENAEEQCHLSSVPMLAASVITKDVLEENTPMAESTASKSRHKAKDQALENPEKRSSRVIEESDNEELAPPPPGPPSQYQFKPPPRVFRQQYKKGHNLKTFELPEDSDGDGDSDASDMVSSESKESDLLEPEESVARALFEEVKVTSTREKKRAMETPRWNESVSTISEFDSSLILADSSFADESDVPVKEEDTEDIQGSARNTTASTQSKEGYRDPMAHLVYTKTGVIQHGILELKAYIAFSHGYPEVIAKNTYAWEILINAAQYLKTELIEKHMRTDKEYLDYAHASLFRRDIKETASKNIAGYFHLGPNCSAILERLLPDHLYIFSQIFDAQGLPYPSVGSQFPQQFFDIAKNKAQRPEIPISMLAIVCTAICAALLAKKNKSGEEFKFTGNQFCDNYNYHVSVLERLRETAPIKFHKMMSDIYEEVQSLRLDTPGGYAQDVSLTFLDIDGMDDEYLYLTALVLMRGRVFLMCLAHKGKYVELWYFTNDGLDEDSLKKTADDDAMILSTLADRSTAWVSSASMRNARAVVSDEDLPFEDFCQACPRFITVMEEADWPVDRVRMMALFWRNIQVHRLRSVRDPIAQKTLLVYQAEQHKCWHVASKSSAGPYDLSLVNERVLEATRKKVYWVE
ncbi:hypothetical protein BDR05DRAFT_950762 [Suillus weaverae]|nr:hypothetical protein BDR05DRAFT_950762 [Suillus weaverae]